ncbi:hypothetical protein [Azospirillum thiophilum]|uniref:hypothetical protein n=1 Tax=Azospirillum thiophilum TaxID=528244 RepID=UPI000A9801D5|nr:hypothetical protein [Azospirillum thiophilum]
MPCRILDARVRSGVVLAVLLSATVACDAQSDGNSGAEDSKAGETGVEETGAPAEALPTSSMANKGWLDANDRTPPEQWLASRSAHADLSLSAPSVASFHALLVRADHAYDETPRMIANRVVQLQEMLAGRGMAEGTDSLIEGFLSLGAGGAGGVAGGVAGRGSKRRFGEDCQHYFYLRSAGLDHRDALAALRGKAARPPR